MLRTVTAALIVVAHQAMGVDVTAASAPASASSADGPSLSTLSSPFGRSAQIRRLTGGGAFTTDWSLVSPLLASDPTLAPLLPSVPSAAYAQALYSSSGASLGVGSVHTVGASAETAALCSPSEQDKPILAGPNHVCTSETCSGPGYEAGTEHCRAAINGPSVLLKGKLGTWWARALGSPAWATFSFAAVPSAANHISLRFKLDFRYRPELYGGNPCTGGSDTYDCAICTASGEPWDHHVPPGVHVLWSAAGRDDYVITGPVDGSGDSWDSGEYYTDLEAPTELNLQPGEHPVVTFLTFSQYGAYGEVSNPNSCSVAHSGEAGYSYKDKMLMLTEASVTYQHVVRTDWGAISPLLLDESLSHSLPVIPSSAEALALYSATTPMAVGEEWTVAATSSTAGLCEDGGSAPKAIQAGPSHVCTSTTCSGPGYEAGTKHCRAAINGPSVMLRGKLGTWWARALGSPAWATFTFPAAPSGADSIGLSFKIDFRYRPELFGGNPCAGGSETYDCAICTASGEPWDHKVPPGVHVLWSAAGRTDYLVTGPVDGLGSAWDAGNFVRDLEAPAGLNLQPGEHPVVTFFTFSQYGAYGEVSNPNSCSVAHSNKAGYSYKDKMLMLSEASFRYEASAVETSQPTNSPTPEPTPYPTMEPVAVFVPETNTDWGAVSPLLEGPDLAWALPPVPSVAEAADMYQGVVVGDGAPFGLHSIADFDETADLCGQGDPLDPVRGGPAHVCASETCSGPGYEAGTYHCAAVHNSPALQLRGRLGTYWAKALGTPAWIQFVFPAVPPGSTDFSLRFTLDERYRPELYGGNPCSAGASSGGSYDCDLCTSGPWDHAMAAGVHILWSAAGRDRHVVTGPHDFASAWDDGELTQRLEPPPELMLRAGEYPAVTFMTAFQYPAVGEVPDPSRCSISESTVVSTYRDKPFMLREAALMYRSDLVLSREPSTEKPRLYGTDAEWMDGVVRPFLDAPCDPDGAPSGGWFGQAGFLDIKSNFDLAARGYKSCEASAEGRDLNSWHSTGRYVTDDPSATPPSRTDGYRALHLLRRLWACSDANGGSYDACEVSEAETNQLADAVLAKELQRFSDATWSCGASCGGSGDPAFDLTAAEQVSYFTVFYDVMSSRPGLLPSQDDDALAATLRGQMELFRHAFWTGQWQLWNGNNWTPHLCVAALEWAITFWHEEHAMAREVLGIVNDIMWLHRRYYTLDGTYTEGVIMYSIMSIEGQMAMAALQRASFGAAPAAISVEDLRRVMRYMVASMSTDGYMIDFGDSHKNRGWSSQLSVIEAALAATMVDGDSVSESSPAMDAAQMRAFAAAMYGSGGFYSNPWRLRPGVLDLNSVPSLRDPPANPSQPLGNLKSEVFATGGYATVRAPLLEASSSPPCFGSSGQELCVDAALPSLADNIPYSTLALQARPNRFSHSEVDFGQVTWSAWGTRLLSEFSYGTIATSVNKFDMRRYQYLDNNPAGHNTVVIREAFQEGSADINFSQLSHVDGSLSEVTAGQTSCTLLDGSDVYGALRDDGWLDTMRRYSCTVPEAPGSFLMVDVLQVKSDRSPMSIYGSQYGGPSFYESSPASQRLRIDEYFHSDTAAPFELADGIPRELPFDRSALSSGERKWCQHVDVEVVRARNSSVALRPRCGIGSYRDADGMGIISGVSAAGEGRFEYDGLITSVDRWLNPHTLKKKRFRFVTDGTVGAEGDVRAFVLAPSAAGSSHEPPHVQMERCAQEFGCEAGAAPVQCSCVQACLGESLQWLVVQENELRFVGSVGTCSASLGNKVDPVLVDAVKANLGVTGTSR